MEAGRIATSTRSSAGDHLLGLDDLPALTDLSQVHAREEDVMGDVMGTYLSAGIDYERAVYDFIQRQVTPGMKCAVVGAHWGHFVRVMLDIGALVWAFEPHPDNFSELQYRCPEATLSQIAGLDCDKTLPLFVDAGNSGNHTLYAQGAIGAKDSVTIEARRLEPYLPDDLTFALFDAQGCDHLALAGMGDKKPPVVVVEHWEHGLTCSGMDPEAVLTGYAEMGYYVKRLDGLNYLLVQRG